jgi:hypothetical protein
MKSQTCCANEDKTESTFEMYSHCFYSEADTPSAAPQIIDLAIQQSGGTHVTLHHKLTLDQLRNQYPRAKLGETLAVQNARELALTTQPSTITKAQFMEALEVLPPLDWVRDGHYESFKSEERFSGKITAIYARTHGVYWSFRGLDSLSHDQIIGNVLEL